MRSPVERSYSGDHSRHERALLLQPARHVFSQSWCKLAGACAVMWLGVFFLMTTHVYRVDPGHTGWSLSLWTLHASGSEPAGGHNPPWILLRPKGRRVWLNQTNANPVAEVTGLARGLSAGGQAALAVGADCTPKRMGPETSGGGPCACYHEGPVLGGLAARALSGEEPLMARKKHCLVVNLDRAYLPKPRNHSQDEPALRAWRSEWSNDFYDISVFAVSRGPASAHAVQLKRQGVVGQEGSLCFVGDLTLAFPGAYVVEVIVNSPARPPALLGGVPYLVQAIGPSHPATNGTLPTSGDPDATASGQGLATGASPASEECPALSDGVEGEIREGGYWIPCQGDARGCTAEGWRFTQPDCHYPIYSHDQMAGKLRAYRNAVGRKLSILMFGDSRVRGQFLGLAMLALGKQAANIPLSTYWKVWGIIELETQDIRLCWRDMRSFDEVCEDDACWTARAPHEEDLKKLMDRVRPDIVYAHRGIPLVETLLHSGIHRVALRGWAMTMPKNGFGDWLPPPWPPGASDTWRRFDTFEVQMPLYRELCNDHGHVPHPWIHMHAVCKGGILCGVVNDMTVQIYAHDMIRWMDGFQKWLKSSSTAEAAAATSTATDTSALRGGSSHLSSRAVSMGSARRLLSEPLSEPLDRSTAHLRRGLRRSLLRQQDDDAPAAYSGLGIRACKHGLAYFTEDYVPGMLDQLECLEEAEIPQLPLSEHTGDMTPRDRCSDTPILEDMLKRDVHPHMIGVALARAFG